jgi:hypothetical protein
MKDEWYGDNRDLVKWVLELARRFDASCIIQVLYRRPSEWGRLEIDGEQVQLPPAVVQHFRNPTNISAIQAGFRLEVVTDPFGNREEYLQTVLKRLKDDSGKPRIVFLDPDTGLESRNPGPEHVLESELATIWREMSPGDVLVIYHHQTNRDGTPWIGVQEGAIRSRSRIEARQRESCQGAEDCPRRGFVFRSQTGKAT